MKNLKNVVSVITLALVMLASINVNAQDSFDKIGLEHNKILKEILLSFDSDVNKKNVFNLSLEKAKINKSVSKSEIIYEFSDYSDPFLMLEELKNKKLISMALYSAMKSDLYSTMKFDSARDIDSFVENKKQSSRLLPIKEVKVYEAFLSIMKHSSEFWDPKNNNGVKYILNPNLGDNSTFLEKGGPNVENFNINHKRSNLSELTKMMKIDWWKVMACDTIAGFGGPGASAIASSCSIIMQL